MSIPHDTHKNPFKLIVKEGFPITFKLSIDASTGNFVVHLNGTNLEPNDVCVSVGVRLTTTSGNIAVPVVFDASALVGWTMSYSHTLRDGSLPQSWLTASSNTLPEGGFEITAQGQLGTDTKGKKVCIEAKPAGADGDPTIAARGSEPAARPQRTRRY